MVLYPVTAFRAALRAAEDDPARTSATRAISATGCRDMLTRAELYDLLGYTGYEERDRKYFG